MSQILTEIGAYRSGDATFSAIRANVHTHLPFPPCLFPKYLCGRDRLDRHANSRVCRNEPHGASWCLARRLIQSKCETAWSSARALSCLHLPLVNLFFFPAAIFLHLLVGLSSRAPRVIFFLPSYLYALPLIRWMLFKRFCAYFLPPRRETIFFDFLFRTRGNYREHYTRNLEYANSRSLFFVQEGTNILKRCNITYCIYCTK